MQKLLARHRFIKLLKEVNIKSLKKNFETGDLVDRQFSDMASYHILEKGGLISAYFFYSEEFPIVMLRFEIASAKISSKYICLKQH